MSITALELRAFRLQLESAADSAAAAGLLLLEDNEHLVAASAGSMCTRGSFGT